MEPTKEELKQEFKYKRMDTLHKINMNLMRDNKLARQLIEELIQPTELACSLLNEHQHNTSLINKINSIIDRAKQFLK